MKSTDPHGSHAHPDPDMPESQGVPESGTGLTSIDPVCGMTVTLKPDTRTEAFGGEDFHFCSGKPPAGLETRSGTSGRSKNTLLSISSYLGSCSLGRFPPGTLFLDRLRELPGGSSALSQQYLNLEGRSGT